MGVVLMAVAAAFTPDSVINRGIELLEWKLYVLARPNHVLSWSQNQIVYQLALSWTYIQSLFTFRLFYSIAFVSVVLKRLRDLINSYLWGRVDDSFEFVYITIWLVFKLLGVLNELLKRLAFCLHKPAGDEINATKYRLSHECNLNDFRAPFIFNHHLLLKLTMR